MGVNYSIVESLGRSVNQVAPDEEAILALQIVRLGKLWRFCG